MKQQFQVVRSSFSIVRDITLKSDFEYIKSLVDEINEEVYSKGESFLEPFAVDNENTPNIDELFPSEIEKDY